MLRSLVIAAATTFALGSASAQSLDIASGEYKMDPTHASIVWKVDHIGLSFYTARFTRFDATIDLDAENPEESSVFVTIDPTSVHTAYPFPDKEDFDATIAGPKWLDSAQYPEITFAGSDIEITGENTGKITGEMTMHGVTKPVTLDVRLNAAKPHPFAGRDAMGFSATGSLKRSDFGITHLIGNVGDEVTFTIEAEFIKTE